jgi:glutathione peroxidase
MSSLFDFSAQDITGQDKSLSEFRGRYVLVVNVASQCGFTPQYQGLQELSEQFPKDLVVIGFPCNQFGKQEPGSAQEIQEFCDMKYRIRFPLFNKIDVNGENTHPVYKFLKSSKPGLLGSESIKWNFTKFLIDRNGQVIERFAPTDSPSKIGEYLKKMLP